MLKACPFILGGVQGCIAPPKFPNLQKKSPKLLFGAKEVWKIGNFMYFWTKKWLKIQGRSSFVRFAPSEVKNSTIFAKCPHSENQEEIHFWKMCTLLRWKSLVWAWLKPVKCIGLGSKGGLGSWAPSIFWVGGLEYPLAPQKILYP